MSRTPRQVSVSVSGRVQGVSFRYYTLREAVRLNLTGWVRNERDGTVSVAAEGSQEDLDKLISFLRQGSPGSRVSSIEIEWLHNLGEYDSFQIIYR